MRTALVLWLVACGAGDADETPTCDVESVMLALGPEGLDDCSPAGPDDLEGTYDCAVAGFAAQAPFYAISDLSPYDEGVTGWLWEVEQALVVYQDADRPGTVTAQECIDLVTAPFLGVGCKALAPETNRFYVCGPEPEGLQDLPEPWASRLPEALTTP